jgi:hypothetical protein
MDNPEPLQAARLDRPAGTRLAGYHSAALRPNGPRPWIIVGALLAFIIVLIYGESIRFGLLWDDPLWFRQGNGLSLGQLLGGTDRYQFYRPLTLLYLRLWWLPPGGLASSGLHLVQITAHVVVACLTLVLARQWTDDRRVPVLAGLLVAIFPFSQQAVAWAAPQQPLVTALLLASFVAFTHFVETRLIQHIRHGRGIALYVGALAMYAAALFMHESALGFALLFSLVVAWRSHERRHLVWSAPFLLLAAIYGALWWYAPRLAGVAGGGAEADVAAFLAQAVSFPVARLLPTQAATWSAPLVFALCAVIWLLVVAVLWRTSERRVVLLGAAWTVVGLLPIWIGLSYVYVEFGQRLAYQAVPGIALTWAAAAAVGLRARQRWQRLVAISATVAVVFVCFKDVLTQERLMAAGADHLAAAIGASSIPDRHAVFINFPDRMALRRPPYPRGYWGTTLAPVAVEIAEFARAASGRAGTTESWSVPATGGADRVAWPYEVDLRGVIVGPAELLAAARGADGVYLSDYLADGRLRLRCVGAWLRDHPVDANQSTGDSSPAGDGTRQRRGTPLPSDRSIPTEIRAELGDVAILATADLTRVSASEWQLRLGWRHRGGLRPNDAVFVHVFGPDNRQVAGADGDAWGGLLPLAAWPTEGLIEDMRSIDVGGLAPGVYRVTVGIYQRRTNQRYLARDPRTGARWPDDEVPVGQVWVPER